jgi:ubiquinone/menaquinone biosynthesis C-methylase UbiE
MTDNPEHPEIDLSQFYVLPPQEITLPDIDNKGGWILDVGGGGEGIIGLLKGRDVVAIDMLKDELTETSNDALKVVMDARDLQFTDESFAVATVYFTFMYIPEEDFEVILKEIWRVLKHGGEVLVWDVVLRIPPEERETDKFVIILKTIFPNGQVNETGYGGKLRERDADSILKPALKVGFKLLEQRIDEYHYFVKLEKP